MPSNSEDEDDNSVILSFTLLIRLLLTLTDFVVLTTLRKEYSTSTRIKAIYILKEKKPPIEIKEAIGVSRTRVYILTALTK